MNTTLRRYILLAAMTFGVSACADSDGALGTSRSFTFRTPEADAPERDPMAELAEAIAPETTLPSGDLLGQCTIEPLWFNPEPTHRLNPAVFTWTPDMRALMMGSEATGSGSQVWGAATGEPVVRWGGRTILGVTPTWDRMLVAGRHDPDASRFALIDPRTERTLWIPPASNDHVLAVLSPDGRRVAMVGCTRSDEAGQHPKVTIFDVDSDAVLSEQVLGDASCAWSFGFSSNARFSDDGQFFVMTGMHQYTGDARQPEVFVLDADGGTEARAVALGEAVEGWRYEDLVATVSVRPGTHEVHAVTSLGEHFVFDAKDPLAIQSESRGAFIANHDTYLPHMPQSPMAWGMGVLRLEASVAPDGAVELRRAGSRRTLARIFAPEVDERMLWQPQDEEVVNPPVAVAISPGEDMIAVAFRRGLGVWGCEGALPERASTLERVTLHDVPSEIGEREAFTLGLDLEVTGGFVHGVQVVIDGEPQPARELTGEVQVLMPEPGERTLQLKILDGVGTMDSDTHVLEVHPRKR